MKEKLVRELGVFSVVAVACGAMLSGLLVLPGYGAVMTGPSVFLAFLVAGLMFLPATLSSGEMATALPEAGGDYLFIDRALGPLFSTISGLGTYLTFLLKSAFALAGMGAYLLFVASVPYRYAQLFAVVVAVLLTFLNYRGIKKTGFVQKILFFVTVIALFCFMGRGSIEVQQANFKPFLREGYSGFFTAVAFVFISYAGVTKITSIAEEIRNPRQTIPVGILVSLGLMVFLYVFVVYVMVGTIPVEDFNQKKYLNAPLALAGLRIGDWWGALFLSSISVVALVAMANAGLMASSRYPFALSRHDQLPQIFSRIHPSFSTPGVSILSTGLLLCVLILFFPVIQLAKLASTFQFLVFALINAALIILRESDIEWYRPSFRSPGYPYVQILGIIGSIVLIGFLGWVPFFASLGLIAAGAGWYFFYARTKIVRKGALQRERIPEESTELFKKMRQDSHDSRGSGVLVPVFELSGDELPLVERRIRLAAALCSKKDPLEIVHFSEVPSRSFLSSFQPNKPGIDRLTERVNLLRQHLQSEITLSQVVTHHTHGALRSYVEEVSPRWVIYKWITPSPWQFLVGKQEWWLNDFPCNLAFFNDHGKLEHRDIYVLMDPVPYEVETVLLADQVARYHDGNITFLNRKTSRESSFKHFADYYPEKFSKLCSAPTYEEHLNPDDWIDQLKQRTSEGDLLILGTLGSGADVGGFDHELEDEIANQTDCSVLRARTRMRYDLSTIKDGNVNTDEIDRILREARVLSDVNAETKEELFSALAGLTATPSLDARTIREALRERENTGHTYLEDGRAFPHATIEEAESITIGFATTVKAIPYTDAGDEADVFAVLIGPGNKRKEQFRLIRVLARLLSSDELEHLLRGPPRDLESVTT